MDNNIFPNPKQICLLFVFLISLFALYFFITGTLPQLLGYQLSDFYITVDFALCSFSVIPLIIYFSKKSKVPLYWSVNFPGFKFILLVALLSITLKILTTPMDYTTEFFDNLFRGELKFLIFRIPEFNLNKAIHTFSLIVTGPIIEEYFCRKQLLSQLLKRYNPTIAIILSSIFLQQAICEYMT